MYLSHAVRTIRDDPVPGESIDLVVTRDGEASAALGDAISALGGTVVADLQFDALHVQVPQTAVADLCGLDGIERIETAETLRLVDEDAGPSPDDDDSSPPERT